MPHPDILSFDGEFRWLSNFYPAPVNYLGDEYPTVENAYQAAKFPASKRDPFVDITPGQAKHLARSMAHDGEAVPNWQDYKVTVMRSLLNQKFARGSELAEKLLATGNCQIVEGNTWGDTYWGVYKGKGDNVLGLMLMDIRAKLRRRELTLDAATEYITKGGVHCPFCGSDDLTAEGVEIDGGAATQEVGCGLCGENWIDTYTLAGIQPV